MSIFKRKSKAKEAKKAAEQERKQAVDDKPTPAPYKHVPKHAGADAAARPTQNADQARMAAMNEQRMSIAARDYAMGTGAPSLSPGAGPQRPSRGPYGMQKNHSAEVFTTDPDAPPMPKSPMLVPGNAFSQAATPTQQRTSGATGGYFPQASNRSPSFDSPMLGNPKMQMAARDRGYVDPHNSSDSGYGSVAHSRAPSEHLNLTETNGAYLPRNNSGFLPEMSLSEELAREPAFSEHSFGDESQELSPKKAPEGVLKSGKGWLERQASQLDTRDATRSSKQTRFEHAPEAVEPEPAEQLTGTYSQSRPQQQFLLGDAERTPRPESATIPQFQFALPTRTSTPPPAIREEVQTTYTTPSRDTTPQQQVFTEPQAQYTLPARTSTPPPPKDHEELSSPIRYSSPPPQTNYAPPNFAPLERVISNGHQSIMSVVPVSKLEGFKVNKRGKILDEEGEPIGELCEGDIIDCVRQKVNAYGEVLDDYGSVVGRVRTIGRGQESPVMRMASPTPFQHQQQLQYQPELPVSPSSSMGYRRPSAETFTPAWQQQHAHNAQPNMAQELQYHMAATPQESSRTVVPPIDYPNNGTVVELPANEAEIQPEEEILPILDHSDVFLPAPNVPEKSSRRNTPSPPIEKQQPRRVSEEHVRQRGRMSQETPRSQSRLLSAPVAARPQSAVERQPQEWAAAGAIEKLQEEPEHGPELPPHMAQQRRQGLARSSSAGSMMDTSKSYSRPTMSSVPEDSQLADEDRSPALFSYKGEIPTKDGPPTSATLAPPPAMRAKSPAPPSVPRQNSANFNNINSIQFSPAGAAGQRSLTPGRQFSTGVPGPRPSLSVRNSSNAPMKRSPLSSHGKQAKHSTVLLEPHAPLTRRPTESTPHDSDESSFESDKIGLAHGMHSRQQSMASMRSASATVSKPRTYFTHGGQITLDSDQQSPAQAAAKAAAVNTQQPKSAAPSVAESKKKSRFSLGFGKKAVAA